MAIAWGQYFSDTQLCPTTQCEIHKGPLQWILCARTELRVLAWAPSNTFSTHAHERKPTTLPWSVKVVKAAKGEATCIFNTFCMPKCEGNNWMKGYLSLRRAISLRVACEFAPSVLMLSHKTDLHGGRCWLWWQAEDADVPRGGGIYLDKTLWCISRTWQCSGETKKKKIWPT